MTPPTENTLNNALSQTGWHIEREPAKAVELARKILEATPDNPRARLYLAAALRRLGNATEAQQLLGPLSVEQPGMALVWYEFGLLQASRGETQSAIDS